MCYISRKIYTVCAHTREGELVECRAQKHRIQQRQNAGFCNGIRLSLSKCWPLAQTTEMIYGFCEDCRCFYKGHNTGSVNAILNYWAFKNSQGYSVSVPAHLVPADEVFGRPASVIAALKQPRGELLALGNELPRKRQETTLEWLQRLEGIRRSTLGWAGNPSPGSWPQNSHLSADVDSGVLRFGPRAISPMSAYPYAHVSGPTEEPSVTQETAAVSHDTRGAPQVHLETLRRLCGGIPSGFFPFGSTESSKQYHQSNTMPGVANSPSSASPRTTAQQQASAPIFLFDVEEGDLAGGHWRWRTEGHLADLEPCISAPVGHSTDGRPDADDFGDACMRLRVGSVVRSGNSLHRRQRGSSLSGSARSESKDRVDWDPITDCKPVSQRNLTFSNSESAAVISGPSKCLEKPEQATDSSTIENGKLTRRTTDPVIGSVNAIPTEQLQALPKEEYVSLPRRSSLLFDADGSFEDSALDDPFPRPTNDPLVFSRSKAEVPGPNLLSCYFSILEQCTEDSQGLAKDNMDKATEPDMTSHFSFSDFDPDEVLENADLADASRVWDEDYAPADDHKDVDKTDKRSSEPVTMTWTPSAVLSDPFQPKQCNTPSRFDIDRQVAPPKRSASADSWSEIMSQVFGEA
ncbi:hypothetical protein VTK56DRAFT_2263 [Thermocarpiscus australiensis]